MPDLSGAADVDVVEVFVKAGDSVEEGDSLIALETDKASLEVPAPHSGTVVSIAISEGATVNEGDHLCEMQVAGSAPAPVAAPVAETPVAEAVPVAAEPVAVVAGGVEDILIPDLSGAADVDVVEVLVKDGDSVAEGDSLIVLETDKASMEVPAPKAGTVKVMQIKEGDQVNVGDLLMSLEVAASSAPASVASSAQAQAPAAAPAKAPAAAPASQAAAKPAATASC